MLSLARSGLLVACVAFVACASGPEPRTASNDDDDSAETPKKKKKKKKRTGVFGRRDVAKSDDDGDKDQDAKDDDAKDEKPAKAAKAKDDEAEAAVAKEDEASNEQQDEVRIVDDTEIEPEPKKAAFEKPKKKKKGKGAEKPKKKGKEVEADTEEVAEKPKKKSEELEADTEEVAPKKKNKELEDDTEEVAEKPAEKPKKKGKTEVVAAKSKKKAAPEKKTTAEEDIPEIEIDSEPVEEPEPKARRAKAKRSEPEPVQDEGDVIDMEAEDDPLVERRVAAISVPGVDDGSESDEPEEEPLPPGAWPPTINDRPLVLAKGKATAHAGLRFAKVTVPDAMGTPQASTAQYLTLGGTYGLGDKVEVGIDYALGISPGTVKGPLTLHAAYRAKATPKLEVAFAGGFAFDFLEITPAAGMPTTSQTNISLQLGMWARYRINRKASLFTGLPATPASPATVFNGVPANPMSPVNLANLPVSLPAQPYHLSVGFTNNGPIAFDMPAGAGYQITPNIYGYAVLNLAHLKIKNTENAFLFKDFIPLALGGFYTRKQFDVGVVFADDLKQGTDYLRLDLLLRYYVK